MRGDSMNFCTVRDLRTHPRDIWKKLSETREIIITNNGKPIALMIEINDENLEDVLSSIKQATAIRAVNKIRIDSSRNKTSDMSTEDIFTERSKVREEKLK
jgi:antitoxin (DNA-binding transcriptional repressor) of toxin-antitoxin stability system